MPEMVPVLEFIHELDTAGIEATYQDILERPMDYWQRLPPDRRATLLARMDPTAKDGDVKTLQVIKRRGRPAADDNVFVRVEVTTKNDLSRVLSKARESILFEDVKPRKIAVTAHAEDSDDLFTSLWDTRSVFKKPTLAHNRQPTITLLDAAWEGPAYDTSRDGTLCEFRGIPDHTELARYWVDEPFAQVVVLQNENHELLYHLEEPRLTHLEQALLLTLNDRLRDVLVLDPSQESEDRHAFLARKVFQLLRLYRFKVDRRTAYKLGYYFVRNYLGFGPLEPVMRDPSIEDVSCNGPEIPLYVVHSRFQNVRTNLKWDELELNSYTIKLTQRGGKLLSIAQPMVDATLPDGSRIQASLGKNVTSRGSAFTIRKFKEDPLTAVDLIRGGTHTPETMAFLWLVVEAKRSIVVMGATASGKTTTLNCLSQFIPPTLKIVSLEDTREITLHHENWLSAVTRESFTGSEHDAITMYDLLRAALRQRPEYIIVGEIRGQEGLTLFQAMSTGHTCYSTMHAGSVENAVYRLENPPIGVPRVMLTSLDYFLLQGQVDIGGKPQRRMLALTEVNGIDPASRNLRTNEIFRWNAESDIFETITKSTVLEAVRSKRGWSHSRLEEELAARRRILEDLVERKQRHYREVARAVQGFYFSREDPDRFGPSGSRSTGGGLGGAGAALPVPVTPHSAPSDPPAENTAAWDDSRVPVQDLGDYTP